MDALIEIDSIVRTLKEDFEAIAMPRSAYVLEHLVVKAHEHPSQQFLQCVLEMRIKYNTIRRSRIQREIINEEIARLDMADSIDRLQAELKRIDLEEMELSEVGAMREFFSLYRIYQQMPRFTAEQIEAGQAEYWYKRLVGQSQRDVLATGRVGQGNIQALEHIGVTLQVENPPKIEAYRNGQEKSPD